MHRLIGNLVRAFFDSQLVYLKVISSWFTSLQWEKRLCNILMRILFITSISTIPKERVIVQGRDRIYRFDVRGLELIAPKDIIEQKEHGKGYRKKILIVGGRFLYHLCIEFFIYYI